MTFSVPRLLRNLWARLRTEHQPTDARIFQSPRTYAGVWVDEDQALRLSAVWACVRLIANTVAKVPWRVYEQQMDGGSRLINGTVDWLLHKQPNPEMSAYTFRQTLMAHVLLWGNGYAEIQRDGAGRPFWLWPMGPDRVRPQRDTGGSLYYEVSLADGGKTELAPEDVLHFKGMGFDGVMGYSVIRIAAQSLGVGLAAEEFGAKFYGNGAHGGMALKHPNTLGDQAYKRLKESFDEDRGGLRNAHKVKILEEGMDLVPLFIPPEEAQFLETRKFQVNEICRWFGLPPHKIGDLDRATFSNIEHQAIEFVSDCIDSWAVPFEQEADIKLFGARLQGRYFTKHNLQALMRGDAKSRAEFYQILFGMGALSPNEIRALEDQNPIGPAGDKRLVQLNLTTLDKAGEQPEPVEPKPQAPQEPDAEDVPEVLQ